MSIEAVTILEFIKQFHAQNHWYPTQREIAKACHLATSTVNKYFTVLEARGHIIRSSGTRIHRYYVPSH